MATNRVITGLDVGTKKICALIAEVDEEDNLEIVGLGLAQSKGLRKGIVVDIDRAAQSIANAVKKAERMAGIEVGSAFVGIAGSHISSENSHGVVAVTGSDKEVKNSDIERVMEAARVIPLSQEERIIHVIPREFIIDGTRGIKHPQGMSGVRLEVETHIVKGSTTSISNLVKSVEKAGLEVNELVLDQLASSYSVLSPDEKELGVSLVDIGGGTTDFIVFHEGNICYTSVLPVGGNHVSNDIAVGLRTPVSEAENLKILKGAASCKKINKEEKIEVLKASGDGKKTIPRQYLCEVIEPRMEEVFGLIRKEINKTGSRDLTPAGLVITGGASMLEGTCELASSITGLPVRLGKPDYISGFSDIVDNPVYINKDGKIPAPIFATGVGLILYALDVGAIEPNSGARRTKRKNKEIVNSFFSKLKSFFDDFF
ncbi:MAG: cell division protein FtsA [Bacillota bacterium]